MGKKLTIYVATFFLVVGVVNTGYIQDASATPMVGLCTYTYDYTQKLAAKLPTWNDSANKILATRIKLLNNSVYDAFYVMTPYSSSEKLEIDSTGLDGYPSLNGARGGSGSFLLLLDPSNGNQFDYDTSWWSLRSGDEPYLCASAQQGVTYTTGYSGLYDPFPSRPVTSYYSGTVDCIDPANQTTIVNIVQDGNYGAATVTYLSPGVSTWTYNLTSGGYTILVDCGGVLAASLGIVSPATTSGNWLCNIYENPAGCVLI